MQNDRLKYTIDGLDLSTVGIFVTKISGIFDQPKRKLPYKHSWQEFTGEDVDLTISANDPREITLDCILKADSIAEATTQLNNFFIALDGNRPRCLSISLFNHDLLESKALSFLVFREEKVSVDKTFKSGKVIWSFTIKLQEYLPCKRIFKINIDPTRLTLILTILQLQRPIWVAFDEAVVQITESGDYTFYSDEGIQTLSIFSTTLNDYGYSTNGALELWSM